MSVCKSVWFCFGCIRNWNVHCVPRQCIRTNAWFISYHWHLIPTTMAGSKCYLFLQLFFFFFFLFILIFVCLFILCVVRWFKHSGEKSDLQIIRVNLFQELVKVRPIRTMSGRLLDVASFFVFFWNSRWDTFRFNRRHSWARAFPKKKKKIKI